MDILYVALASLLSAVVLFATTKIMGHRQVAQLGFFDYITGITIGSIAAELATELEKPWKPLIAMLVYGAVSVILSTSSKKLPRLRKYINGTPTVIMDGGKLYRKSMKKAKLELGEFLMLCRQAGYFHLDSVQTAIFEYNGKLSVLPTADTHPATPKELGINTEKDSPETEVIMDGRILEDNLRRMGLDATWLKRQLKESGGGNPKDIFLATCDKSGKLYIYKAD